MLDNVSQIYCLAEAHGIPTEDILLLDLNISGARKRTPSGRIRFQLHADNGDLFATGFRLGIQDFYLALPTRRSSPYHFVGDRLMLGEESLGQALGVSDDYCDASYPRREGTVLNINPNARTACRGCRFCYTAFQTPGDRERLLTLDTFRKFLHSCLDRFQVSNLSHLIEVAVVTGCFANEREVVAFLAMARSTLNEFGFGGELFYFGSQIVNPWAIDMVAELTPFGICFSLEVFEKRDILRDFKSQLRIGQLEDAIARARERGIRTNFSYVVGLESMQVMERGFRRLLPEITSFPIINVLQIHPGQDDIRCADAGSFSYYLDTRRLVEDLLSPTPMRPRPWENYRGLWYLSFACEPLLGPRTPLPSTAHELFNKIVGCASAKEDRA